MRVSFKLATMALAIGLAAGTPPWVLAQTLPAGMSKVTSVEGVDEYRLGNGLQVLLIQGVAAASRRGSAEAPGEARPGRMHAPVLRQQWP